MKKRLKKKPNFARYFPSFSDHADRNPNIHMFNEDVWLGIMPIGGKTDKQNKFEVRFEGQREEGNKAKCLLDSLGEHKRYDEKGIVCDAVENIAKRLAWEGRAVFEIVREGNNEIYLDGFTSRRLFRLVSFYIQFVPQSDWDFWKKKIVIISSKNVWQIDMPSAQGGRFGYKRVLARLKKIKSITPEFFQSDLEAGAPTKSFDFQEYVRNCEIYFRRVTRTWGWNRRNLSQDFSTEFYTFYKTVTFRWSQAVLREHIIDEINKLFRRLQIKCKLVVTGLPTAKEILQTRDDMQNGKIAFNSAFDQVTVY